MKKIFKIVAVTLAVFLSFINTNKALELKKEQVENVWYTRRGGTEGYFSADYNIYSIDGKTTYCIEPGIHITTKDYIDNEGLINSPYSDDINNKIELIGYYGYDYPTHGTLKYRMATQALIWEETGDGIVEYWTEPSGGGKYLDITKEKEEIMRLVDEHSITPKFDKTIISTTIGNEVTITDVNNVLKNFEVVNTNDAVIKINGNNLLITPTKIGEINIILKRKTYTNNPTTIYTGIDEISQKMGYFGLSNRQNITITVKSIGGKVTVQKLDADNLSITPQGDAVLIGAIYGIYTIDNKKIGEIKINANSTGISDYLPLGKYYLKEEKVSKGYTLDENLYYFEINEENLNSNIKVYEKVIERNIEFFKVYADARTGILKAEPNAKFEFYLKSSNKLYASGITDKDGHLIVTLPYGTYIVHQVSGTEGYEKIQNFEISVTMDSDNPIYRLISNSPTTAKLKVVKVDSNSKRIIVQDGIKFKIKNIDTNEYVCQTTTYPNATKLCIFETKGGFFITPEVLETGHYQIEEVENQTINGYLWNPNPLKFTINDDSDFIYDEIFGLILEVMFENTEVKGQIEVNKKGEKFVVKDDTFYYEEIALDGITYNLYADEDIYSGDGTLIHKKNELIGNFFTIDGKFNIHDLYLGRYCLVETATVEGHILDSSKHCFNLEYKDQYTPIVSLIFNFKNYLPKGTLEFTKTDLSTSEGLPNTLIQIYDEFENLIFEGMTDDNGKIIINKLKTGKYYLYEKQAPDGYILNTSLMFFEIKENGEIVKVNMPNEKNIIEVPKTSVSDFKFVNMITLTGIIEGFGLLLYDKKKKI